MINPEIKRQIKNHAFQFPDQEICGIVADGEAIAINNVHPDKKNYFQLHPMFVKYRNIQAIYHSHWSDFQPRELSDADINISNMSKIPILVYHTDDYWDYYEPDNPNPYPIALPNFNPKKINNYLNWRFKWGRTDCFALVRRYYLGMFDIAIGDFTRSLDSDFPKEGYQCPWKAENNGFIELKGDRFQNGDIVEMALIGGQNANHIAVVTDAVSNTILHTVGVNRLSEITTYGSYWRQRTIRILRHQKFL